MRFRKADPPTKSAPVAPAAPSPAHQRGRGTFAIPARAFCRARASPNGVSGAFFAPNVEIAHSRACTAGAITSDVGDFCPSVAPAFAARRRIDRVWVICAVATRRWALEELPDAISLALNFSKISFFPNFWPTDPCLLFIHPHQTGHRPLNYARAGLLMHRRG